VVVVGGGDTAVQEGLYLTRFCKEGHHRAPQDRRESGGHSSRRASKNEKIQFAWNAVVSEIWASQSVKGVSSGTSEIR